MPVSCFFVLLCFHYAITNGGYKLSDDLLIVFAKIFRLILIWENVSNLIIFMIVRTF